MSCIQHGLSNKCVCKNCNKTMGLNKNLNELNKNVKEVDFISVTHDDIKPIVDRLSKLEKHYQTDYKTFDGDQKDIGVYKDSFYEPPSYYKHGQEFNYPYKFRNQDNIWFHNEGGDFGGHSLYKNPYVGPRNTYINQYAYGPQIPYYNKKSHSNPYN